MERSFACSFDSSISDKPITCISLEQIVLTYLKDFTTEEIICITDLGSNFLTEASYARSSIVYVVDIAPFNSP